MLIFDLEADGFLDTVSKVHCISILDTETGVQTTYNDQGPVGEDIAWPLQVAVERLRRADVLCGHNIIKYDIPVLDKLYGFKPQGRALDTLIYGRLAYPEIGTIDDKLIAKGRLLPKYRGLHKLEAWGFRLGVLKDEYEGGFEVWTPEMEDYCKQDVLVTYALWQKLEQQDVSQESVELEHAVATIISRQERYGIAFDSKAADDLACALVHERNRLSEELRKKFGCWYAPDGKTFVPKGGTKRNHYTAGVPLTKVKLVQFNPGSRQHIAKILRERFGWVPDAFTPSGEPEVSEEALASIKHPEAQELVNYLTVVKRLGQLAEGKEAWMGHDRNGRIHGSVNTLGTVTGRMSHSNPNVAQVPAVRSPYGKECRALFRAGEGRVLVGCDAAGLELRVLAHFMAPYDKGVYAEAAVKGSSKEGTDIHTLNMRALGITSRDNAKTWFYAFLYGAGNEKLGRIVSGERAQRKNQNLGKKLRDSFLKNLPAMKQLLEKIRTTAVARGHLRGLDGRKLAIRSPHSAPNTLFQSAGAVVMKKALVILDTKLQEFGFGPGDDYEFVINCHDEWQIETIPYHAETVGKAAVQAIRDAGAHFGFRCPLDGEFRVGTSWAETH